MRKGVDELVEHLLVQVALKGSVGASVDDLKSWTYQFYHHDAKDGQSPPQDAAGHDEKLCRKAWSWLAAHPGISVQRGDSKTQASYDDALAPPRPDSPAPRLHATPERVWRAIAGHAVDHARVPRLCFELLSLVAGAGPDGILQPTLTQRSGQDKRSVPKRTDTLAAGGYIVKQSVTSHELGCTTALCTLKRFAREAKVGKELVVRNVGGGGGARGGDVIKDGVMYYGPFLDYIVKSFGQRDLVTLTELKRGLGIETICWEAKMVWNALARLDAMNITQRIRARARHSLTRWVRCVRLLRRPTDQEREHLSSFLRKAQRPEDPSEGVDAEDDQEDDEDDAIELELDAAEGAEGAPKGIEKVIEVSRRPPQWDPDVNLNNLLFDLADAAGKDGLSSMEMRDLSMGPFWKRPSDVTLGRLTDIWHLSQPPHLRHLAIVRDTALAPRGKQTHYQYRSFRNFQRAVEAGDTAWQAVMFAQEGGKNGPRPVEDVVFERPDLDEWGFPKVDPKQFLGKNGVASLKECHDVVPMKSTHKSVPRQQPNKPSVNPEAHKATPKSLTWKEKKDKKFAERDLADLRERAERAALAEAMAKYESQQRVLEDEIPPQALDAAASTVDEVPQAANSNVEELGTENGQTASANGLPSAGRESTQDTTPPREPQAQKPVKKRGRLAKRKLQDVEQLDEPREKRAKTSSTPPEVLSDSAAVLVQPPATPPPPPRKKTRKQLEKEIKATIPESRIREILMRNLSVSKPGVYVNPPGSKRPYPRGRPRLSIIMVVKHDGLLRLDWFRNDPGETRERPSAEEVERMVNGETAVPGSAARAGQAKKSGDVPAPVDDSQAVDGERAEENEEAQGSPARGRSSLDSELPNSLETSLKRSHVEAEEGQTDSLNSVEAQNSVSNRGRRSIQLRKRQKLIADHEARPGSLLHSDANSNGAIEDPLIPVIDLENPPEPPSSTAQQTTPQQSYVSPYENADNSTIATTRPETPRRRDEGKPAGTTTEVNDEVVRRPSNDAERLVPSEVPVVEGPSNPPLTPSNTRKRGVQLGGGGTNLRRAKLVMDIVSRCGGVFPGDSEIRAPFIGLYTLTFGPSAAPPDRGTILRCVKGLVDAGQLKRLVFVARDRAGCDVTKRILALPDVQPGDPRVRDLQREMTAASPRAHMPPQVEGLAAGGAQVGWRRREEPRVQDGDFLVDVPKQKPPVPGPGAAAAAPGGGGGSGADRKARKLKRAQRKAREALRGMGTGDQEHLNHDLSFALQDSGHPSVGQLLDPAVDPGSAEPDAFEAFLSALASRREEQSGDDDDNLARHLGNDEEDAVRLILRGDPFGSPMSAERPPRQHKVHAPVDSHYALMTKPFIRYYPNIGVFTTNFEAPLFLRQSRRTDRNAVSRKARTRLQQTLRYQQTVALTTSGTEFYPNIGVFSTSYGASGSGKLNAQEITTEQLGASYKLSSYDHFKSTVERIEALELAGAAMNQPVTDERHFVNFHLDRLRTERHPARSRGLSVTAREDGEEADENFGWDVSRTRAFTLESPPPDDWTRIDAQDRQWERQMSRMRPPAAGKQRRGARLYPSLENVTARPEVTDSAGGASATAGTPRVLRTRNRPAYADSNPSSRPRFEITAALSRRLVYAITVIRTLLGGKASKINWKLLHLIFLPSHPDFDDAAAHNRWTWLSKTFPDALAQLQRDYQEAYLAAYASGAAQRIDYARLHEFGWHAAIDWAEAACPLPVDGAALDLPADRAAFDAKYALEEVPHPAAGAVTREHIYKPGREFMRTLRERDVARYRFAIPLDPPDSASALQPAADDRNDDDAAISLAANHVRATMATPAASYSAPRATALLSQHEPRVLSAAVRRLLEGRALKQVNRGRAAPGPRGSGTAAGYALSEPFRRALRRPLEPRHFDEAVAFKRALDERFVAGDGGLPVPPHAPDGAVLALTDLVAAGRVALVPRLPPVDHALGKPAPRLSRWGFTEGHWKTNQLDRRNLFFAADAVPTASYAAGPLLPLLRDAAAPADPWAPLPPPPHPNQSPEPAHAGKFPLYASVHAAFLPDAWRALVTAVLQVAALRSPLADVAAEVERALNSGVGGGGGGGGMGGVGTGGAGKVACVEGWEVELVAEWCARVGALVRVPGGMSWTVGEGWWAALAGVAAGGEEEEEAEGRGGEG